MAVQNNTNLTNIPFRRSGEGRIYDNETFEQDAGRSTALAVYTLVAQKAASQKWVPLTDVDPELTAGKLVAGALGTNLAGFQAVTDGEYAFSVDGVLINITGLDFSAILALHEVADTINAAAAGRFFAAFDSKTNVITYTSPTVGVQSTVSVMAAVSGGTGTDISGSGFLNGAAGTATAGAGNDGSNLPTGIILNSIAAADLVAGDVSGNLVLVGGNIVVDRNQVVLENSLTLNTVVVSEFKTILRALEDRGIFLTATIDGSLHQA